MVGESIILDGGSGWSMSKSTCRWVLMLIGRGIVLRRLAPALEVLQLTKKTIPTNSDRPPTEVLKVVRKDLLALQLTLEYLEL